MPPHLDLKHNDSVDNLKIDQADDAKEMIKLNYNRIAVQTEKDFSKKAYPNTKVLQNKFNDLILQHSNPAAMLCQVNDIDPIENQLT